LPAPVLPHEVQRPTSKRPSEKITLLLIIILS
jgi:hypothetical protein